MDQQVDPKIEKAKAAAAVKAERKERAGLSRTLKLRLYPEAEQAKTIHRTIGTIRFVWNTLWLPMLKDVETKRIEYIKANGETHQAWKAAFKAYPDPTDTKFNQARMAAAKDGSGLEWIREVPQTPLNRAAINFADAVKASRGLKRGFGQRKIRAGRVQPKGRRDDPRSGLEWQIQGKSLLGGRPLTSIVDAGKRVINAPPAIGCVRYRDKGRQMRAYVAAEVEACEITVKREGQHFYACIAVRGLQPAAAHAHEGEFLGIDMGVAQPLVTSQGEIVISHQGHDIKARLAKLELQKLRIKRKLARKLRAAAKKADALTPSGGFKKGVRIPTSNRARRQTDRMNKVDRHIVGFRADWQRKQALQLVRQSEIIVVEALTIKNMTKSAAGTVEKPGRNVRAKSGLNRVILARGVRLDASPPQEQGRRIVWPRDRSRSGLHQPDVPPMRTHRQEQPQVPGRICLRLLWFQGARRRRWCDQHHASWIVGGRIARFWTRRPRNRLRTFGRGCRAGR